MYLAVRVFCCVVVVMLSKDSCAQFVPQPVLSNQPTAQMNNGSSEIQTVVAATQTLDQFFGLSIESIPPNMLNDASGVAIFPHMIKGGFILGVNFGKGVLHVRNQDGTWSPPAMVTMGGGSVGFQAGVQAADIVLVFKTPQSLNGFLEGQKVTLGADAAIAAGPVGRQANASTDARLGAEIYSYARSRGLFLGVSLGGADVSIDGNANGMLYGRIGLTTADIFQNRGLALRPEVIQLVQDLNARTQRVGAPSAAQSAPSQALPSPSMDSKPPVVSSIPTSSTPATRISAVPPSQATVPLIPIQTNPSTIDPPLVPIVPR